MARQQIKVELQSMSGGDRDIANAAWTSSHEYQVMKPRSDADVAAVINLLADHKHSVPFESVHLRFWLRIPIAVDRQLMTHRLQSSSGMSGRYRTMPSEFLSVAEDVKALTDKLGVDTFTESYHGLCHLSNQWYSGMLKTFKDAEKAGTLTNTEYKRLREFVRGVLPQHNFTERISIMNLRAFANFIKLRNSVHAQPEIKQVAEMMLVAVTAANSAPVALEALARNGWSI